MCRGNVRIFTVLRKFHTVRVNVRSGGIKRDFAHAPVSTDQGHTHTPLPTYTANLSIGGGEATLQHGDHVGQDSLPQFPHQVPESAGGHLALVGRLAAEEGEKEGDECGEDLAQRADGVRDDHFPDVERCLTHHQRHVRPV